MLNLAANKGVSGSADISERRLRGCRRFGQEVYQYSIIIGHSHGYRHVTFSRAPNIINDTNPSCSRDRAASTRSSGRLLIFLNSQTTTSIAIGPMGLLPTTCLFAAYSRSLARRTH
jgi:hypothetical protein